MVKKRDFWMPFAPMVLAERRCERVAGRLVLVNDQDGPGARRHVVDAECSATPAP